MTTISLIQGASKGIGLQFCKSLLSRDPQSVVIATCRSPDKANELLQLQSDVPNRLHIHQLDVTKTTDIENVCNKTTESYGRLDLLINSAGMLHPSGKGETSLRDVTAEGLRQTFATNTIGPLIMAKYFSPLLRKGNGDIGRQISKIKHAGVLVNMSAKVGSITDNGLGGWYSYRLSKAALNMATKNLSIELGRGKNKITCISLHPGTVDTDLSRPYHKGVPKLFSTEESVRMMLEVIDSMSVEDTGKFFTYDKTELSF
ncbi:C-factor-like [Mytilus californianus]|uniref:C-factor-like n=1 Tax=Mytilus californianus TaxID=6549 RepID=UPI0022477A27|nr:C-factor-like [Mytilus californianus]XP_052101919.1 C-factor-like [Mytilus californianus]XP_052101920.1 C-factor-like [Mytilus californianus]